MGWNRMRDENTDSEAYIYALAVGAGIWLGSYLWKRYHKPNRKLPPLEHRNNEDDLK